MRRRLLAAVGVLLAALAVTASAGSAYAYFWDRARADLIARGVHVAGIDVGGLRAAAAGALVDRSVAAPLRRPLLLVSGGWRLSVDRARFVDVDVDGMVSRAVQASRAGSLDDRLLRVLRGRPLETSVALEATVSAAAVDRAVARVARSLDRPAHSARVVPTARRLRIVPSRKGRAVEQGRLRAELRSALLDPTVRRLAVPTRAVRAAVTTADLPKKYPSYVLVDRAHFRLRVFRHLKLARVYPIAVGRAGLETPAGLYRIDDRQVNPSWHVPLSDWAGSLAGKVIPPGPADPIKARWLGFFDGAGIHGTDELSSIGTAASHGCIRMRIPDVISLYPLVPLGTPIYVG